MKKYSIGDILNAVSAVLLVACIVWGAVSCMQVANQCIAPWNLFELLF